MNQIHKFSWLLLNIIKYTKEMFMVHPVVSSVSQQLTNNQNKYVNSDHVGAVLIDNWYYIQSNIVHHEGGNLPLKLDTHSRKKSR